MNQQVTSQDFQVSNGMRRLSANGRDVKIFKGSRGWCCVMKYEVQCETLGFYIETIRREFSTLKQSLEHGAKFINR